MSHKKEERKKKKARTIRVTVSSILVKKRERETFIVRAFRTVRIKEERASEREREREKRERRETRERQEREKSRNRIEFFDVDPAKNSIAHAHTSDKKR